MTRKEHELTTALQALLLAVCTQPEGKARTADQIFAVAGHQAITAILNSTKSKYWHDEIKL